MKTLEKHTLIYDDECPMCDLYTRGFIKTKMMDANGRVAFSKISDELRQHINAKRACNEIALINHETGETTYGIQSLFTIIGNQSMLLKILFRWAPFAFVMKHIYGFISYNRKVIAPGKVFEANNSCTPQFNRGYRWAYIIFTWVVSSFIGQAYAKLLIDYIPPGNLSRAFLICGGQIIFQGGVVFLLRKEKTIHYIGNVMTITIAGAVLLLPAMIIHHFISMPSTFYAGWFAIVVLAMFLEHIRRVHYLQLPVVVSFNWVMYRLLVLLIIFYLL